MPTSGAERVCMRCAEIKEGQSVSGRAAAEVLGGRVTWRRGPLSGARFLNRYVAGRPEAAWNLEINQLAHAPRASNCHA